jgi:hypothetical protein
VDSPRRGVRRLLPYHKRISNLMRVGGVPEVVGIAFNLAPIVRLPDGDSDMVRNKSNTPIYDAEYAVLCPHDILLSSKRCCESRVGWDSEDKRSSDLETFPNPVKIEVQICQGSATTIVTREVHVDIVFV